MLGVSANLHGIAEYYVDKLLQARPRRSCDACTAGAWQWLQLIMPTAQLPFESVMQAKQASTLSAVQEQTRTAIKKDLVAARQSSEARHMESSSPGQLHESNQCINRLEKTWLSSLSPQVQETLVAMIVVCLKKTFTTRVVRERTLNLVDWNVESAHTYAYIRKCVSWSCSPCKELARMNMRQLVTRR